MRSLLPLFLLGLAVTASGADGSGWTAVQQAQAADRLPAETLRPAAAQACVGGMAGGTWPCSGIDLQSFLPHASMGGGEGNDIWGWTDPVTGHEFALVGETNGTAFVDVTDPLAPVYLGRLPTQSSNSIWRDIKTVGNFAVIVSEASSHGMQVFDLTRLRAVATPPVQFTADAVYTGFGSAHNVVANEDTGYVYAVGTNTCSGGLHMVNLANPLAPANAGCYSGDGYVHDAQCVVYHGPDTEHDGKEICMCANEDTVTIVDVTNKAAPVQLSRVGYTGSAYTHQGWFTEDQAWFLVDDELDEQNRGHNTRTYAWNMANLDAPVLQFSYTAAVASIDHNLYVRGNHAFLSNYRSGLRVLDLSDLNGGSLTEAGYFDVYPSSDSADFNGAWSVYPYFASGNVIVNGIEQGLFVLRPTFIQPDFTLAGPASASMCGTEGSSTATIQVGAQNGFAETLELSVTGLPSGASASFSPAVLVPPGTSQLTLSGPPATGAWTLTVTGDDGAKQHALPLLWRADAGPPQQAAPASPAHNATGIPRLAALSWTPQTDASSYHVEVSEDSAFGALAFSATVPGTSLTTAPLDGGVSYYWRVIPANACGDATTAEVRVFTTSSNPCVLVVDDDGGQNYQTYALNALTNAGYASAVQATPVDAATLGLYDAVVWMTGNDAATSLTAAEQAALQAYLEGGGGLILTGQNIAEDLAGDTFLDQFLHASLQSANSGDRSLAGLDVMTGLSPFIQGGNGANNQASPDVIAPLGGAVPLFQYAPSKIAGLFVDGSLAAQRSVKDRGGPGGGVTPFHAADYRIVYLAFGFEAISSQANRDAVMARAMDLLDGACDLHRLRVTGNTLTWQPSAGRFDLIRGDLANVSESGGVVNLGAVTCVADNTTSANVTDTTQPTPGQVLFWLARRDAGAWGQSSAGGVETPASGACP